MRTFVTGLTGSGKTTMAERLARDTGVPFVNYDHVYGYQDVTPEHAWRFLGGLPPDCVVDAVPYDHSDWSWRVFNEWAHGRTDVDVRCNMLPRQQWLGRPRDGRPPYAPALWQSFWTVILPQATFPITYIDSSDGKHGEVLTHEQAMAMVDMPGMIRERIGAAQKGYDAKYQDVPEIDYVGYSGSAETWRNIKGLADWREASVVDCGTFHGYTLFRVRDTGCTQPLLGLDFLEEPLTTARAVNHLRGDNVEFRRWSAGGSIPGADVTLCLNALHHFPDDATPNPIPFLDRVWSPLVIFEADTRFEALLRERWRVEVFPSARPGRAIYRCTL